MKGEIVEVCHLTHYEIRRLFALHESACKNVSYELFVDELKNANWLFLMRDEGEIQGFSIFKFFEVEKDNKMIGVIYSGDTFINKRYWGSLLLHKLFIEKMLGLKKEYKNVVYWFRTLKGFRSYRYFPLFFKEYYPRYDKTMPDYERDLINIIGRKQFCNDYDDKNQIVKTSYILRKEYDMGRSCKNRHHIEYFLRVNPNYNKGDELACIAKLEEDNIKESYLRRYCRR